MAVVAALALAAVGCGSAATPDAGASKNAVAASAPAEPSAASSPPAEKGDTLDAAAALCRPATSGSLQARLQGAIDAEIDWAAPATPQCLGGPRPDGHGLRLLYKGKASGQSLLFVIGVALPMRAGLSRNVPANVTVVREGAGEFYATQGDDKCALDEVRLEPAGGSDGQYRLSGRGYCTQPARAIGGHAGAVLVSRFDVTAVIDAPKDP